jgi:hypothetical protein
VRAAVSALLMMIRSWPCLTTRKRRPQLMRMSQHQRGSRGQTIKVGVRRTLQGGGVMLGLCAVCNRAIYAQHGAAGQQPPHSVCVPVCACV